MTQLETRTEPEVVQPSAPTTPRMQRSVAACGEPFEWRDLVDCEPVESLSATAQGK